MDVAAMTLNAYLDEWLVRLRTHVQPTSLQTYVDVTRAYLRPGLGDCRVGELTVRQLNLHFVHLLQQGGRRGGPLARKTLMNVHAILRQALGDAVRDGRLHDNVAARVTLPKLDPDRDPEPQELHTWDAAQAARFLELAANDPLQPIWRLALATGMRRGELLGLRFEDLDLDTPQVRVRTSLAFVDGCFQLKTTKSGRGRTLALDADTAATIATQPPPTRDDWPLVFTTPEGLPWRPEVITNRWRRQWPGLDLPKLTLHQLRHCHACLLLDQGVPMKVVSERLGHSTIAMTMNVSAHVLPAQDRDAAAAIQRALHGTAGTSRSQRP